ncbi:MAG: hypothetical protein H7249_20280 [Chitinophagaceae bacterium]|nr:hypothetical protein [Oligoflexus sp.]
MRRLSSASFLLGLGLTLFTVSCAHFEEQLKTDLEPWVGQSPDRLVEQWGAPNSNYAMTNGTKVLSYFNERSTMRSAGMGRASWRFGTYTYTDSCKVNFFTDANQKKIERYTTTGDIATCLEAVRDLPKP